MGLERCGILRPGLAGGWSSGHGAGLPAWLGLIAVWVADEAGSIWVARAGRA